MKEKSLVRTESGFVEAPANFLEHKSIGVGAIELKDIDMANKIVSCRVSAFGNKDFDDDVMVAGCYAKSIAERGPQGSNEIFYLRSHDWDQPLGKPTKIWEDSLGLNFETPITSGATFAEDALKLMAAGLLVQNSVGFSTTRYEMVRPDQEDWKTWYRRILEVKLWESSAVVLGANPDTPFLGFKSMTRAELDCLQTKVLKTIRSGEMHDETYIILENQLKQIQREAFLLGQKTPIEIPAPSDTDTQGKDTPSKSYFGNFSGSFVQPQKSFIQKLTT